MKGKEVTSGNVGECGGKYKRNVGGRGECGGKEGNVGKSWERREKSGECLERWERWGNVGGTLGELREVETHNYREDDLLARYFLSSTYLFYSVLQSENRVKMLLLLFLFEYILLVERVLAIFLKSRYLN